MDKIVIYCRLSNARDSAYYTENDESVESDEQTTEE